MAAAQAVGLVMKLAAVHYMPSDVSPDIHVYSQLDCAHLCAGNQACMSLIYKAEQKKCFIFQKFATEQDAVNYTDTSGVMFNTDRDPCPVVKGYIFNMDLQFCYKIHRTNKPNTAAKETCVGEGGDGLARLDNAQKFKLFTKDYLNAHVDGQLIKGSWLYSNGHPIRYLPFRHGKQSGTGSCLNFFNGVFKKIRCGRRMPFICQKYI